jgi:DNA topoisomerase VI subunit B
MSEKKVVKVIKREERVVQKKASARARNSKRKTPTDMVSTVTGWVSEFQQKQRTETSKAIENLMRARQQPNEA